MTRIRKNPNQVDLFPFLGKEQIPYQFLRPDDLIKTNKPAILQQIAQHLDFGTQADPKNNGLTLLLQDPFLMPGAIEARPYALSAVDKIYDDNGIIILATGLGKTFIAAMQIIRALKKQPQKKVLILAPTKPLCEQHYRTLKSTLVDLSARFITGRTGQKKRLKFWQDHQIIIATAETIREEIAKNNGVGKASDVCLLIIDEVHHLTGDHAYAHLAKYYRDYQPAIQIIGLTASPDPDIKKLETLRLLLGVKPSCVVAKFDSDQDVIPYTHDRLIKPIFLDRVHTGIQKILKQKFVAILTKETTILATGLQMDLSRYLYFNQEKQVVGLKIKSWNSLLSIIQERIAQTTEESERKKYQRLLMTWALAMRWRTAIDRLNKGLTELARFLKRQMSEDAQHAKPSRTMFIQHDTTQIAMYALMSKHLWPIDYSPAGTRKILAIEREQRAIASQDKKLHAIKYIINDHLGSQILIFTQYRDSVTKIVNFLNQEFPTLTAHRFTGTSSQIDDPGMTQTEQKEILKSYMKGEIDILVSTSIGEEGLDFPAVDVLIFYEPISDVRRYIQRLGRTARHHSGIVYILIYKKSEEETLHFASLSKRRVVKRIIKYYQSLEK
ncbi:MAG: helicase-related protein [Candidatus Komeilibacteria bacterium]